MRISGSATYYDSTTIPPRTVSLTSRWIMVSWYIMVYCSNTVCYVYYNKHNDSIEVRIIFARTSYNKTCKHSKRSFKCNQVIDSMHKCCYFLFGMDRFSDKWKWLGLPIYIIDDAKKKMLRRIFLQSIRWDPKKKNEFTINLCTITNAQFSTSLTSFSTISHTTALTVSVQDEGILYWEHENREVAKLGQKYYRWKQTAQFLMILVICRECQDQMQ